MASAKGRVQCMKVLLEAEVDLDGAFLCALDVGNMQLAQRLLEAGADVNLGIDKNDGNYSAIQMASWFGKRRCVKLLLARGAKVGRALQDAAVRGHCETMYTLLRYRWDDFTPKDFREALLGAAEAGKADVIRLLLMLGPVGLMIDDVRKALALATGGDETRTSEKARANAKCVRVLLEAGAAVL